jgi:tagaturonate reductase
MQLEIAPAIPYFIDEKLKLTFAESVIDRFANPAVDHAWQSVALQYSSKMRMRCLPLLTQHYTFSQEPPILFATCFAAFLLYVKAVKSENGKFFGESNGLEYEIKDDNAGYFHHIWSTNTPQTVVDIVLRNSDMWGASLNLLPGFQNMVIQQLIIFLQNSVKNTVKELF